MHKLRGAAGNSKYETLAQHWIKRANKALKVGPPTVTDKPKPPPSGDKNDYQSLAIYFWPDPDQPDGKPYIEHDGKRNPEYKDYDLPRMGRMNKSVRALSMAWWLTGDEKYAEKGAEFLRTWFINPGTRMNPNLKYGQRIPGRRPGTEWGIVETAELAMYLIDSVALLEDSEAWTSRDHKKLQKWFRQYLQWLTESELGRKANRTINNHSFYYDLQVVTYACFIGELDRARRVLREVTRGRIDHQIRPDGRMPQELARTRPFSYTIYTLRALFALGHVADKLEVQLWMYEGRQGQSIRDVVQFLYAAVTDKSSSQRAAFGDNFNARKTVPYLYQAGVIYDDAAYLKAARQITKGNKRWLYRNPQGVGVRHEMGTEVR